MAALLQSFREQTVKAFVFEAFVFGAFIFGALAFAASASSQTLAAGDIPTKDISTKDILTKEGLPNLASTSLCGDSYLLALAPDRISALSWQSRHALSLASDAQKTLPQAWDDPEHLATLNADAILFGAGEGRFADKLPVQSFALKWGEDFETVFENAHMISGYTQTGLPEMTAWRTRLSDISTRAHARKTRPKIFYITRSGGSAGPGTFIDAVITAAGGHNLIGTPGWVTPDPEHLIALEPDLIITSYFDDGYESVQAVGVRHTPVQNFISRYPRVDIPGALWPCAGPGMIRATEILADALDTLP